MSKRDTTVAIVDGVLKILVGGSMIAGTMVIPNLLIALDKPLDLFFDQMDQRSRERELRRVISYMKSQQLFTGDYAHGLTITKKARKRLAKVKLESLCIPKLDKWDHTWRIVLYDIPESMKAGRDALTVKLRRLGCCQLQRSVWVHPFPCRDVIETITAMYKVERYVTYIETQHIDHAQKLISRFPGLIKH